MNSSKKIFTSLLFMAGMLVIGASLAAGSSLLLPLSGRLHIANTGGNLSMFLLTLIGLFIGAVILATGQIVNLEMEKIYP
jgi:hypothetical protein